MYYQQMSSDWNRIDHYRHVFENIVKPQLGSFNKLRTETSFNDPNFHADKDHVDMLEYDVMGSKANPGPRVGKYLKHIPSLLLFIKEMKLRAV